jgi:ADP-L-glycero-D-manno-heptose 6-epimerase
MTERPTYIVTGGAGFVGANLIAALLSRDPRPHVVVVDNFRSSSFANLVEACERRRVGPFEGEVIARSTADLAWGDVIHRTRAAAVFHLAAITDTTIADEPEMIRENVGGFDDLLNACSPGPFSDGVPLVYASSAATYGSPPQARDRVPFPLTAAGTPNNIYGFSKWLMECEHHRSVENLPEEPFFAGDGPLQSRAVGLRFFNVFGPGEARKGRMASMVYQLATQMLEGKRPRLFTDGSQARDQVYVDDVVDCTIAAAGLGERPDPRPGIYNLGSGVATSFNQIVAALRRALEIPERERPTEYFEMPAPIREFYQDYTCADLTQTERGLGWKPRWNPQQAIEQYGRWLKERRPSGA